LPVGHRSQLLLPPHLLLGLYSPDLFEDVDFSLLDKLFFELDLVLLAAAPLFMGEGIVGALADLGTLLLDEA